MRFPEIKTVPIESVKPYPNNAKKHPDRQIELLAKQIAEGFDQPIVVDSEMTIIKGHGRLLASKKLGLKAVPIIVRGDLSIEQVKAARIADNKLAETDWDMDLLAQELETLELMESDLEDLGFDENELLKILDRDAESYCEDGNEGNTQEIEPEYKVAESYYEDGDISPDDFKEYGEDIETDHECPKCGYKWSGGN